MPLNTRYVPPEQTIVVKGLQPELEVLAVKGFVARFTNALGVAVHADCADKETKTGRLLLYCNFRTPVEAGNALDGVVQFVLQTFPKISEHHQVPGAVLFARVLVRGPAASCVRGRLGAHRLTVLMHRWPERVIWCSTSLGFQSVSTRHRGRPPSSTST